MKVRFIIGLLTLSGLLAAANRSYGCPPPDPYPTAILKVKRGYLADVDRSYLILDRSAVFDGSGSFTTYPGAYIRKYEWDWTDDGTYDYTETEDFAPDGKFDGIATHTYTTTGTPTARLRVTNTLNNTGTDVCYINVSDDTEPDDLADAWESETGASDYKVDTDGDDYSNLVEYVCGTEPDNFNSKPSGSIKIAVPDEASFIQNAIDACLLISGINIVVSEGRHYENNINFNGKAVTVRSTDPDDWDVVASTIIDGSDSGTVIKFTSGEGPDSVLKGLTITGGYVNNESGGGIYCKGVSDTTSTEPTISNCVITDNKAAGHYSSGYGYGGGMYNYNYASPKVINCIFSGNSSALSKGGGMSNSDNSSPKVINCIFSRNKVGFDGGGMFNNNNSDPYVTNCTFSRNEANGDIAGMCNDDTFSTPTVNNCIFWGNSASGGENEMAQIYYASGTPEVNYSCIQDDDPDDSYIPFGGAANNNIDDDPRFVDADNPAGWDGIFGTWDDGLGIMAYSPCVDKADSTVADFPATDITGRGRVDVPYATNTGEGVPDYADLGAYESPTIWFVKKDNVPSGTPGSSWDNAFGELRDALDPSNLAAGDEIWVAEGTYKPGSSRSDTFTLIGGVGVYGGFAGSMTDPQLRDWPGYNKTILSGQVGVGSYHVVTGADGAVLDGFTITGGYANAPVYNGGGIYNSYTSPTISNCVIMDNEAKWEGGGMYNYYCSPTVTNCFFIGNKAISGGGMYNESSSQTLTNCVFSGNSANRFGGGIRNNFGASPTLINCTFSNNSADTYGGGIFRGQNSTVTNCIFWGNKDTYDPEAEEEWLMDESAQIDSSNLGKPTINYSCIQGWTGSWGGQGNFGGDPVADNPDFVDALAPAGTDIDFGTWDDGLRLKEGASACIDAANGNFAPSADIIGWARWDSATVSNTGIGVPDYVDMGAYEAWIAVVVMCWIDESAPPAGPYHRDGGDVTFDADLTAYRNVIDSNELRVKSGCLVPLPSGELGTSGNIEDVLPIDYFDPNPVPDHVDPDDPPQGISIYPFPRDADPELTLQTFIDDFNRICDGVVPDYLCLSVDNSDSMSTLTIQPAYGQFKTWINLPENYPNTDIKPRDTQFPNGEFENERWVDEMKIQVQGVIDGL